MGHYPRNLTWYTCKNLACILESAHASSTMSGSLSAMKIFVGIFIVLLLALSSGAVTFVTPVLADDGNIEVLESAAESRFPDSINFYIKARSVTPIDDIRVYFRLASGAKGRAYRVAEFEPGEEVTAEAELLTRTGTNYIPPGTIIEYSFEVWDKEGRVHRTPPEELMYMDHRFEWQSISSGPVTVYYYGDLDEQRAASVLAAAEKATERMLPLLGIEITKPLQIIIYTRYSDMSSAIPFRSHAHSANLITEGMAFSNERVLLVHTPGMSADGTVAHEFVHLLVAQAAGKAHEEVPAWLNEGLAEYGNIDPNAGYDSFLRKGISSGRLNPLWYQNRFVGKPEDILIAYGQAYSVVRHLVSKYGETSIAELFKEFQDTRDIDEALQLVYGFDQRGLDAEWRKSLGLEPLADPEPEVEEKPEVRPTSTTPPTTVRPTSTIAATPVPPTPAAAARALPTLGPTSTGENSPTRSAGCGASDAGGSASSSGWLLVLLVPLAAMACRKRRS